MGLELHDELLLCKRSNAVAVVAGHKHGGIGGGCRLFAGWFSPERFQLSLTFTFAGLVQLGHTYKHRGSQAYRAIRSDLFGHAYALSTDGRFIVFLYMALRQSTTRQRWRRGGFGIGRRKGRAQPYTICLVGREQVAAHLGTLRVAKGSDEKPDGDGCCVQRRVDEAVRVRKHLLC